MGQDPTLSILKAFKPFRGLSDEELAPVRDIAILRSYRKKTVIFNEGTDKETVYFILEGLVKTYKTDENGHENIVSFLKDGDMFPHTVFFDPQPYPATAETLTDSRMIAIPLSSFEKAILLTPPLTMKVMQMMGDKIRELQATIQQLTGQDAQNRGISFLLKLAERYGVEQDGTIAIPLPITNLEMANAIGTTRETVNRLLNQLRKDQVIEMKSNKLIILNHELLLKWNSPKSLSDERK